MYEPSSSDHHRQPQYAIDMRSDTLTRPTPAMIAAMSSATVGDDVYGEDPTIRELEHRTASLAGKACGLFFPSGTQSNLAALMAHCERGDEYIVGQQAHTYKYEGGGAAVLGSIQPQPIPNAADGTLALADIAAAIKPNDFHFAKTRLITLENTIAGRVLPPTYGNKLRVLAQAHGLSLHLDGARAWNAMIAHNTSLENLCVNYDTVSLCFSKGLGAPVGSVLVGDAVTIVKARRWRKMLGGGMRQAGYLAAACLYALEYQRDRLAEDHVHAARLAIKLTELLGSCVDYTGTNMVFVRSDETLNARALAEYLQWHKIGVTTADTLRFVCHLDISADQVEQVISAVQAFDKTKSEPPLKEASF